MTWNEPAAPTDQRRSAPDALADDLPGYPPAEPDTKDWTWVLRERCPECGFTASDVVAEDLPATIEGLLPRWRGALLREDATVRPALAVWSVLEYGAHVRDVHGVFATRLALMLEQDDPVFPDWDQDATALTDRYDRQDPQQVAEQLTEAGAVLVAAFARVRGTQWARTGCRSNGTRFTVETLGQYFLHDVVHHLADVGA